MRPGHTPFSADITPALRDSGAQTVTVRVHDDPHDLTKPRGKQDWQLEPHSMWYPRTTGIWQTVWLERVPRTYVDKIRWTPHVAGFALTFEARIVGERLPDPAIELELTLGNRLKREKDGDNPLVSLLEAKGLSGLPPATYLPPRSTRCATHGTFRG